MSETTETETADRGGALLAHYGDVLSSDGLDEAQSLDFLLALWQIMQAFVGLGFDVAPDRKFTPNSDVGMDDVLEYLHIGDTAHETVAPDNNLNQEQQ